MKRAIIAKYIFYFVFFAYIYDLINNSIIEFTIEF